MLMVEPRASVAASIPVLHRQEKALLEQIEFGTAKHLAFAPLQAVNLALHRAVTPGQGDPGFDGLIVITDPLRKPLQGCEGTVRRPGQPGIQRLRPALAHELGKVLGSGDGGGHLRMLGLQLDELSGLVLIQPLWSPQDQPGRPTGGEVAGCRLGHGRQGLPRPPRPRGLTLRLAQALGIARHGRVAPSIPTPLELSEEAHGVPVPRVPACQEIRVIGREAAAAAIGSALARGQGLYPEVPKHGILANPQRLGNGPCRPPLLVEGPDLLMQRPPLRLALVR